MPRSNAQRWPVDLDLDGSGVEECPPFRFAAVKGFRVEEECA